MRCGAALLPALALAAGCVSVQTTNVAPPSAATMSKAGTEAGTEAGPEAGTVTTLDSAELAALIAAGDVVLIDVRSPAEFAQGRLAGALNAPVTTFQPRAIPFETDRETILYCGSSRRSERAAIMLAEATGRDIRHLEGGIGAWLEAGGATVTDPASN